MATSYSPHFLWLPKRLTTGKWAWMRKVQQIRHGGKRSYRDYIK